MRFQRESFFTRPWTATLVLFCAVSSFSNILASVTVPGDYPTIQSALNDLKSGSLPSGEVIEVLPGAYHEALTYAEAPKSFTLRSVAGAEFTTIDATGTERSTIYIRNTDADIHIEGFTITGGDNTSGGGVNLFNASAVFTDLIVEGNYAYNGGGLQLNGSSSTIDNCVFRDNTATKAGGGIMVVGGSNVTIADSKILDNLVGDGESIAHGGGIHLGNSTLIIRRTAISNNYAKFAGGGIFAIGRFDSPHGVTSLTLEDSLVSGNFVIHDPENPPGAGGGVHVEANSTAYVTDSIIVDNVSSGRGGGLNTFQARLEMIGSVVEYNQATSGTGGGIHGFSEAPYSGSVLLADSVIRNNIAMRAGGVSMGGNGCGNGGVCGNLEIERVLIDSNVAALYAGGVNLDNAILSGLDSQVLRNQASDFTDGVGGGFRITTSTADIYNTSVSGNFAGFSGGGIFVGNSSNITLDGSEVYANAVDQVEKGGGVQVNDAGPPDGIIRHSVIADNLGFQIREQSCPPDLPSPILSYSDNNISNGSVSALYISPCTPPAEVYDITVFNALSAGVKTFGNYDSEPNFTTFSGTPLPRGGSVLAWTQSGASTVEILNLGSFEGPVGTIDVLPACTSTYWLESSPVTVLGTDADQLNIVEQKFRGSRIIEASDSIVAGNITIFSGANITLKAKNRISLTSLFAVNSGGTLRVQTDPDLCSEEL